MAKFPWDPKTYAALMREEIPDYARLQEEAVAVSGTGAVRILELGTGTGETARSVLARHERASLVGVDSSAPMLAHAREVLPSARAELRVGRLEDPLPEGPFDLVIAVLAVHHLDDTGKANLFARVAAVLSAAGRLVLGDLVIPDDPADAVTPIDGDYDTPSSAADQQSWMAAAGFHARIAWAHRDLAVIVGELTNRAEPSADGADDSHRPE